jgi:flavin-dependent dehydrogenase
MLNLVGTTQIPLIRTVDVLLIDGGLAGLEAARLLGRQGWQVLVIESSSYLGGSLTRSQRPWIEARYLSDELVGQWFPSDEASPALNWSDLVVFAMGDLKRNFEEVLLDAKVEFLYASRPLDAYVEGDRWTVVIGGKSGRQAVSARVVIDSSESAVLTWVSPDVVEAVEFPQAVSPEAHLTTATISFSGIGEPCQQTYALPTELGIWKDQIRVIQGGIADHHGFVEFQIRNDHDAQLDPFQATQERYLEAYETGFRIAEYLVNYVPAFKEAQIGLVSREVLSRDGYSPYEELSRGRNIAQSFRPDKLAPRMIILNPAEARRDAGSRVGGEEIAFRDDNELRDRSAYPPVATRPLVAPVHVSEDICVAGGGTSGAVAGIFVAREGAGAVVVDMNPVLGGTGTIGGVHTHWMSSESSINDEIDEQVKALGKRLRIPEHYPVDLRIDAQGNEIEWFRDYSWNKEVKAYVLYRMNRDLGVSIYTHCLLIGTLTEGDRVVGTVYATSHGLRCVRSEITIDATGDGDVAAFAGADYIFGTQRDRYTMWTSMAQYTSPDNTLNNFTSPADVSDLFDYTRFVLASRRRSRARAYDHVEYVAPRETRHILGDYMVTLRDQLLQKSYPDTVAVFYSNYDLRGKAFADIVLFGLMPPNLDMEIPYRALLPRALENIIISGKAYSITHDALSSARMQRDMQQLGACVAIASVIALQEGMPLRSVPPERIRKRLSELGLLPPRICNRSDATPSPNWQEIIDNLRGDEPMEWLLMGYWERLTSVSPIVSICYADPAAVVPLLLRAHSQAKGDKRLLLARLLLWHRHNAGLDDVIRAVYQELDEAYPLPQRKGDIYWTTGSPEQGIMPEVLYLLYPMARCKSDKVFSVISDLVSLIRLSDRDYTDLRKGSYDYIDCVAYIAERQADPVYIPLLDGLLALPEFSNTIETGGFTPDHMSERIAYLGFSLYRALARCGSKNGLLGLAAFLDDNRAYLSKSSHDELMDITALALPMSKDIWMQVLAGWPDQFASVPLTLEIH